MNPSLRNFSSEFIIKASRSSGKGGQNVNKVSTKVELSFDVQGSVLVNEYFIKEQCKNETVTICNHMKF